MATRHLNCSIHGACHCLSNSLNNVRCQRALSEHFHGRSPLRPPQWFPQQSPSSPFSPATRRAGLGLSCSPWCTTETIRWYIEMSKAQNKIRSARHKSSTKYHVCPSQGSILNWKPAQGRAFWRSDPAQTGLPSKWICISTRYYAFTYCIHCDPHKDIRYNIMIKRQVQAVQTVQSVQSVNMLLSFVFYIIHTCCSVGHRSMIGWWQLQFRI